MLRNLHLQQTNRPIEVVRYWRDDHTLELSPPYQRGDVWGQQRRVNFIRSLLLGIPIPSMIINDRFGADWDNDLSIAVIDGKQRMTAILMLFDGELRIPSDWLEPRWVQTPRKLVSWADLTKFGRRMFFNTPLPFSEGRLATLADEQEVFELVNFGGVPQGETDV